MKEFCVDTRMTNEVTAAKLKETLEAAAAHMFETQSKAAYNTIVHRLTGNEHIQGQTKADPEQVAAKAAAAKAKHVANAETLKAAIALGIKQACEQADFFQSELPSGVVGYFTATVEGHKNPRHASACAYRLAVKVDQTGRSDVSPKEDDE